MDYLAHISSQGEKQSIEEHSSNTAVFASKALSGANMSCAAYLAGYLHDIGKYSEHYQKYIRGSGESRGSVNHTFAGCRLLLKQFHNYEVDTDTYQDITSELISFSIGSHHGLFDCVDEYHRLGFDHRKDVDNPEIDEAIRTFLENGEKSKDIAIYLDKAAKEVERIWSSLDSISKDDSEFYFYVGMMGRLLVSAVVEGDRRDTAEFMNHALFRDYPEDMRTIWKDRLEYLEKLLSEFPTNTDIQKARKKISEICKDSAEHEGGIFRFHAPTGAGKTLSGLRFALRHAEKWNKKRVIFISPLLTILEQNVKVIRSFIGDNSIILEHHSNVINETDDGQNLDNFELLMENWNAPIIITTLAQFLNTLFSGKLSSVRRFHSLCDSVIVIDEVQTVPIKMLTLFNLTMNFLSEICGASILFCSATQPCFESAKHPLSKEPSSILPFYKDIWDVFERTEIMDAGGLLLKEIPDFVCDKARNFHSILIVCNKKSEAEYIFRDIKEKSEYHCFHLSAAMCPEHRRNTLDRIEKSLLDVSITTICVSTQVIEAGVDISFSCVIRMTAGIDSIIQSAGRCNRNGEKKEKAPVYILRCKDEKLTSLEEIRIGKDITEHVLSKYKNNPGKYENDLASELTIREYYKLLFNPGTGFKDGYQDYTIASGSNISIYGLMSDNSNYNNPDFCNTKKYLLSGAFKKAGQLFKVYDDNTFDVIVPYGEGIEIINDMGSEKAKYDIAFVRELLASAKAYTISIYEYQKKKLEENHGLIHCVTDDLLILNGRYYDMETGLILEGMDSGYLEV